MPEPIIEPTTIMVASNRLKPRTRFPSDSSFRVALMVCSNSLSEVCLRAINEGTLFEKLFSGVDIVALNDWCQEKEEGGCQSYKGASLPATNSVGYSSLPVICFLSTRDALPV
jgi:hypothetical protein